MVTRWLRLLFPLVVSWVFLTAAGAKAASFDAVVNLLRASVPAVPESFARLAAAILIGIELAVGLSMLIPVLRAAALRAAVLLALGFFIYNCWRAMLGVPQPCPCFGRLLQVPPVLGAAAALAIAAGAAWMLTRGPVGPATAEPDWARPPGWRTSSSGY